MRSCWDILLPNQQQIIEQAKFTYYPLAKAFEKQVKTIEDQGQVKKIKKIYLWCWRYSTDLIAKRNI